MEMNGKLILTIKARLAAGQSPFELAIIYDLPVDIVLALLDRQLTPKEERAFNLETLFREQLVPLIQQIVNDWNNYHRHQLSLMNDGHYNKVMNEVKRKSNKRAGIHLKNILLSDDELAKWMKGRPQPGEN